MRRFVCGDPEVGDCKVPYARPFKKSKLVCQPREGSGDRRVSTLVGSVTHDLGVEVGGHIIDSTTDPTGSILVLNQITGY